MGTVSTNWLTTGHSGSPCSHDDIYTKMNKKTGKCYSVKLCNPSDKNSALQKTSRNAFGVVSTAISDWIKTNKETSGSDHTNYVKVKKIYDCQNKYSTLRGLMLAFGMYKVESDGSVSVDIEERTNFKLVRENITGASGGSGGSSYQEPMS